MFKRTALAAALASAVMMMSLSGCNSSSGSTDAAALATATPIKHVVVIFGENVSFDHYFATYPNATNPSGETAFTALAGTPSVNGLSGSLLTNNPNFTNTANGAGAANPFRLDPSQAATADMGHNYMPEQQAYDNGLMDLFPLYTGTAGSGGSGAFNTKGLVMGYYDGNTVTGLWNYAQRYAMSDNSFSTTFGPSTPGAINLVSGQTGGLVFDVGSAASETTHATPDGLGGYTMIGDVAPSYDDCSLDPAQGYKSTAHMLGKNIGDNLNTAGVTWGWFQGGFDLSIKNANGTTGCARTSSSTFGAQANKVDYIPHHEPFQYYTSTANPHHTRPSSVSLIGTSKDGANHQYDSHDFFDALAAGNMPAVSFLKAPGYQDGHAGYSDPLDEQTFVVDTINFLMQRPEWKSTAVVIAYDDSDGWYDHQLGQIVNSSQTSVDALTAPGQCGAGAPFLAGVSAPNAQGRCGYGPRQPLLVISPYTRANYVDHTTTDLSSIIRFVEDNWLAGQRIGAGSFDTIANPITSLFSFVMPSTCFRTVTLDDNTGEVTQKGCVF